MVVGGARTAQQCLQAELADELHIDIVPVLLGDGLRLFEAIRTEQIGWKEIRCWHFPVVERIFALTLSSKRVRDQNPSPFRLIQFFYAALFRCSVA